MQKPSRPGRRDDGYRRCKIEPGRPSRQRARRCLQGQRLDSAHGLDGVDLPVAFPVAHYIFLGDDRIHRLRRRRRKDFPPHSLARHHRDPGSHGYPRSGDGHASRGNAPHRSNHGRRACAAGSHRRGAAQYPKVRPWRMAPLERRGRRLPERPPGGAHRRIHGGRVLPDGRPNAGWPQEAGSDRTRARG